MGLAPSHRDLHRRFSVASQVHIGAHRDQLLDDVEVAVGLSCRSVVVGIARRLRVGVAGNDRETSESNLPLRRRQPERSPAEQGIPAVDVQRLVARARLVDIGGRDPRPRVDAFDQSLQLTRLREAPDIFFLPCATPAAGRSGDFPRLLELAGAVSVELAEGRRAPLALRGRGEGGRHPANALAERLVYFCPPHRRRGIVPKPIFILRTA